MDYFTTFLGVVKAVVLCSGGAVGGTLAYRAARTVWDDVSERVHVEQQRRLTVDHLRTQNRLRDIREIRADERGRYPLLYGEQGILRDPNNLRSFTLEAVRETWPGIEQVDWAVKTLIAMQGVNAKAAGQVDALTEGASPPVTLRSRVTLGELLRTYGVRAGYHRVGLGETVNPNTGAREVVSGDMEDFVHVILTGSSGWGKSTALESMAKQVVLGGDAEVCFVDYGVNTFGMMAEHGLYPIADTPAAAVALFKVLVQEMHDRRARMSAYPQAKRLGQYNELSGERLRPIVVFCDEASTLFDKSGEIRDLARDLTAMGRKYGIGVTFGGTDFKADTMPSETRGNCGLRMAMHLEEPGLSRSIIRSAMAVNLVEKGRALASLPGVAGLVELQCPMVERWDDLPGKREQIELRRSSPTQLPPGGGRSQARILELHAQGLSQRSIEEIVYGYTGGDAYQKVRAVLEGATTATGGVDSPRGEAETVAVGSSSGSEVSP